MKKKYIVRSGHVTSKSDGDRHLITCQQLIKLYGVDARECILVPFGADTNSIFAGIDIADYIELTPRANGNYTTQTEQRK